MSCAGRGEGARGGCQRADRDQRRDDRAPAVTGTDGGGRPVAGGGPLQVGDVGFGDRACDVVVVHGGSVGRRANGPPTARQQAAVGWA